MDTTATISALAPGVAILNTMLQGLRRRAHPAPSNLVADIAAVRALADSYRHSDPGFAADLYAAAARHEVQSEGASWPP